MRTSLAHPFRHIQAMLDLNGRFFAGRVVAATFYDETRFGASDLAPSQEELKSLER